MPDGTLSRSLATPWRLNLAATAYEERHPDTLAYLREPDHLLARYLPAAAHQHPTRPTATAPTRPTTGSRRLPPTGWVDQGIVCDEYQDFRTTRSTNP